MNELFGGTTKTNQWMVNFSERLLVNFFETYLLLFYNFIHLSQSIVNLKYNWDIDPSKHFCLIRNYKNFNVNCFYRWKLFFIIFLYFKKKKKKSLINIKVHKLYVYWKQFFLFSLYVFLLTKTVCKINVILFCQKNY